MSKPLKPGAVDDLVSAAVAYNSPERLEELIRFTARLRRYAPFNAMLLHAQDPKATLVATASDWKVRHGRELRAGARPLVILAPMHPVLFVFDVRETTGPDLPEAVEQELKDVFAAEGVLPEKLWRNTLKNCERLGIGVREIDLGPSLGGRIASDGPGTCLLSLNAGHTTIQRYVTMVHEIAHLFLGHVTELPRGWWHVRSDVDLRSREFEAEIATYIVCSRAGIRTASDKYLAGYIGKGPLPYFSLDEILLAAGRIEEMGRSKLRLRKPEQSASQAD